LSLYIQTEDPADFPESHNKMHLIFKIQQNFVYF
jgi:hypothetical protein